MKNNHALSEHVAQDQEDRIESSAKANDLIVTPSDAPHPETLGQRAEDASITAQIKTSLLFHHSTHAMATNVVTKDGVVTLTGKALNEAEKDLASKLAEDIRDVKLVRNQMIVQGP